METERILELADLIEAGQPNLHFNMSTWGEPAWRHTATEHLCGTAACIAGWTVARFGKSGRATKVDHRRPVEFHGPVSDTAATVLGLDVDVAEGLFMPCLLRDGVSIGEVTASHAVRTLRHLAETGEVDWRATMKEN